MAETLAFTVCYSNEKSCSAHADLNRWKIGRIASENLSDYDVVKVTDNSGKLFYFGLDASSLRSRYSEEIFINGLYATKLGIKNNSTVSVNLLKTVPICLRAWIEPVTVDDWEILEIHAEKVEGSFLDQVRVLWPGQVFPLWVTSGVCIFLRTVAVDPTSQCGILMPLTELIVEPKVNRWAMEQRESASPKLDTRKHNTTVETRDEVGNNTESDNVVRSPASTKHTSIETECGVEDEEPTLLQRLMKIWIIRRVISLIKYIWNLTFQRIIPSITGNFAFLQVAAPSQQTNDLPHSSLSDEVLAKIKNFPSSFDLVLRIEDTQQYSTRNPLFEHYDQAGYALLDYSRNNHVDNQEDYQIFLVRIQKLPVKNIADTEQSESEITNNVDKAKSEAVVRLCVRARSKFAMFLCDDNEGKNSSLKVVAKSLKLSAVLRMQHKIGITSKVKIQKLSNIPKPVAKNVKTIIFQTLGHARLHSETPEIDFQNSLKDWITIVSDVGNPLPITCGTIFLLPVRSVLQNQCNNHDDLHIYVRIEKIIDHGGNASSDYYLFTRNDFSFVEIEFVIDPVENFMPLDEIDPKIPSESIAGLIPSQNELISQCQSHCENVYQSRPIPHKLCNNVCHPGFIMITGPSGIGKSYISRALLRKLATSSHDPAYVRWVSCSNFKGKKPETIKKMLQGIVWELEWRQPSALLLDDFDQLVGAGNSADGENSPSATYMLQLAAIFKDVLHKLAQTSEYQSKRVVVIATSLSEHTVHPLVLPAQGCYIFSKVLELTLPEGNQRKQFLKAVMLKELSINSRSLSKLDFEEIASLTEGYSPKDYEQLLKRVLICGHQRSNVGRTVSVKTSDVVKAMNGFVPISLQDAKLNKPKKYSWEDVGGLEDVRKQLREKLVWPVKYSQLYQSAGMQLRSGILLYGPPGCGKTLIAGVVANECNLNFISVKGPELLNKYIGASEAAVRELFHRAAAAAPCLLFFDEFDSIAQKRGHDNTGVTDRVVNQFLTHLDGVEPLSGVYVLAATSRPDLIDPAILRPGRLDTHLHCPMPDFDERCRIIQCLIKKISLTDEINIRAIAAKCEYFTGADLRALVYDAQLSALHGESDVRMSLNCSSSSTVPTSSQSVTPSSLELEIDDQYSSNGFNAVINDIKDESIDPIGTESDVSLTVQDFTKAAAKLARSLQEQNPKSPRMYGSGQYQICYSLPVSNETHPKSEQLADLPVPVSDSDVIYFPSLYSKMDGKTPLPESVRSIVEDITQSGNSNVSPLANKSEMKAISVQSHHFDTVLESASPSVSASERQRYIAICDNFGKKRKPDENRNLDLRSPKRTTLA